MTEAQTENKSRWWQVGFIWTICLILLTLCAYIVQVMYARYVEEVAGTSTGEVGMFLVGNDLVANTTVLLDEMVPGSVKTYEFSVQNFDATRSSEVTLSYDIQIQKSNNLPLTFSLYKNSDEINLMNNEWVSTNNVLRWDQRQKDNLSLVITWPAEASDEAYADLTDYVDIWIVGKQVN